MHKDIQLQLPSERCHQGSLNILCRSLSLGKLYDPRVDPSSKYTPVVISTFTSHLWKRKKGLVLVVCIAKYQPRLVIAWKTVACVDMWVVHSRVTWVSGKRMSRQNQICFCG